MLTTIKSAVKAVELYLTIKSKKTNYDLYYDALDREKQIRAELLEAKRIPNSDDDLVDLIRHKLRHQASIRESAQRSLRAEIDRSGKRGNQNDHQG
jgi:hypothetical protein